MWSQVILFCALLFGSKFVASIPLDDELGQQRAFESNIWQGTQNEPEPYHGTDFALAHNENVAQHVPTTQEFKINPRTQHSETYGINEYPASLQALPARNVPVNFALDTNERRHDGFVSSDSLYPIRNQNQPIAADNHFQQQNWPPQNRLENVAPSAIGDVAEAHDRTLVVQDNFQNSGQTGHFPPVNRQYYQADNRHQIDKDVHYHPAPRESGNFRYVSHTATDSETHTVPVRYENYQDANAHSINKANHGYNSYKGPAPAFSGVANPRNVENYNRPVVKNFNNLGSYVVPPGPVNNNNGYIAPPNKGFNHFNNRYVHNPSLPSASPTGNRPPIGFGNTVPNFNSYRYMENLAANSVPTHHVPGAYSAPKSLPATVDELDNTRNIQKPIVNNEPNNIAPVNTYNVETPILQTGGAALPHTGNNDSPFTELTINHNDFKKISEGKTPSEFYNTPLGNQNGNIYHFPDGENAKEYFLNKIKKNFVIIYANGTVEYVNNLHNSEDPEYILLNNDKQEDTNTKVTSENKETTLNNKDSLPDKIDSYISGVSKDNDEYNEPILDIDDTHILPAQPQPDNDNNNLSAISQQNQETTPTASQFTNTDQSPSSGLLDNHNPLSAPYIPQRHNFPAVNHESRHNYPSRIPLTHLSHKSNTGVPTTITPTPDDAMIEEFLDSLSNKSDEDQPTKDNSSHDRLAPDAADEQTNQTLSETHTTIKPLKLHTVISPGIFRSTTSTTTSGPGINNQESSTIKPSSSILNPSKRDENTDIYQTTSIPLNNDSDSSPGSTPVDQIITISPIELATDNVKNGSNPTTETTIAQVNVDSKQQVNKVENVHQNNETSSLLPSNPNVSQKADNVDNALKTISDEVKNNTKSACNDCNDPAQSDDNSAATTNEPAVNTGDSASGDNSFESQPPKNGLEIKLNIPSDAEGTLYVKVDAPEGYTGNEDEPNDETLLVTITKQNTSNTDTVSPTKDSNVHDDLNNVPTNSDETNPYQNLKLDLSNALVVMNRTNDKDYLNQLLPSDSKVNLFIFQMPCQDQAIVEKYKEVIFYANGTCVEQLTETRWKNKDDPSPVIITTKKIHADGKCN